MFTIVLHHLSSDAKTSGTTFPDLELRDVPEARLRSLVVALAQLASKNQAGAVPELRINGPQGRFTVQLTEGKLRFNSWSTRVGGFDLTTDQILSIITGTEDSAPAATRPRTGPVPGTAAPADEEMHEHVISPGVKIGFLVAVIVAINAITVWMATKPPENPFLPQHSVLAPEPADRLVKDVAGEYRTGSRPGDRGLTIERDGRVRGVKFGAGGAVIETTEMTSQPVQSAGHAALLVNGQALIEFVDSTTLTLYGDTYRRKSP